MEERAREMLERLVRDGRLKSLAVNETGFAFDPRSGQSFTINHTGMAALGLLRQGSGLAETAAALAREYGVVQELVEGSLESFVRQLGRYLS